MRVSKNFLMGLTSSIWVAALGFLVVPLYLRYLGIGAYGLIGFFATMQAILSLVDFGIVPTINREVARSKAIGVSEGLGDLLYMLERIYFLVGLVAAIGIIALSELIANHWLSSGELGYHSKASSDLDGNRICMPVANWALSRSLAGSPTHLSHKQN